ncbi:glycoside hydrolase family 12 protein [Chiua virens]|nr:glycoside hydrolase family 12 protein [Chiua virens]
MVSWCAMLFLLLLLLVSVSGSWRRSTTVCGAQDTVTSGSYSLSTNLWGESGATSGRQCSTLESVYGNIVAWYTNWTWTGGTGVKSFSNIQLNTGINRQLSEITTIPSTWAWNQWSNGPVVVAVTYDLYTSDVAGGSVLNELMIWLANFNAGPLAAKYTSSGQAIPTASNLTIAGYVWDFYSGSNGYCNVYSFLPVMGTITSFNGDIYEFFTYLMDNGYVPSSHYLVSAQAGTEATSGTATLSTSAYSLMLD